MWYQVLPACGITAFFFALPQVMVPAAHYVLHGVPCIRQLYLEEPETYHWRRDQFYSYKQNGDGHRTVYLEGLPDRTENKTN